METKMEELHAHEVMEMMMTSGKSYNRTSLATEIRETFGANTRFYTCSANGLSPEQLIDFLAMKGKFGGSEEAFYFNPSGMCQGH